MKKILAVAFLPFTLLLILSSANPIAEKPAVLIFSKTNGFRHESIPAGIEAIKKLGASNGFDVVATEDSLEINKSNLKKFAAVIFLSPTGKVFGPEQEEAFQNYIEQGGGYVGIHAATDCEYNWPWYGKLAGAYFKGHPSQQEAKLIIVNKNHPSTAGLPDTWVRKDEWYNFKDINPDITVLIKIDESSYKGGENGGDHPMAWYHAYDGGRAFYTELGHTNESFSDPLYLKHLLGGIEYAMGSKK
jgi:type 1 glutamine amidotransferase